MKVAASEDTSRKWSLKFKHFVGLRLNGIDGRGAENPILLKLITLMGVSPHVIDLLRTHVEHTELVENGMQLSARLPAYLGLRGALLITYCPLPLVLQHLVAAYAEPTYTDAWESELL